MYMYYDCNNIYELNVILCAHGLVGFVDYFPPRLTNFLVGKLKIWFCWGSVTDLTDMSDNYVSLNLIILKITVMFLSLQIKERYIPKAENNVHGQAWKENNVHDYSGLSFYSTVCSNVCTTHFWFHDISVL